SLVDDALERRGVATAGRAVDRALDVLTGHVHASRAVDRQTEAEVRVGIGPAFLRGKHDFLGHLGEDDASFDVGGALLALDLAPLWVPRHRAWECQRASREATSPRPKRIPPSAGQ